MKTITNHWSLKTAAIALAAAFFSIAGSAEAAKPKAQLKNKAVPAAVAPSQPAQSAQAPTKNNSGLVAPAEMFTARIPVEQSKGAAEVEAAAPVTVQPDQTITPLVPTVASNYVFATATTASLTDMSTGTAILVAPDIDDTPASNLTNIGFEFFFQGVRYTQFSVNANGVIRLGAVAQTGSPYKPLAQAGPPIITAYGADQRTHAVDGKVHFKVIGSAPTRTLVIEWLNMQANFNSGGTADLTYQVRLNETTGVIENVYGSMTMSAAGAIDANSLDPNIGFSTSNVPGTVGSVAAPQSGAPAPTFDGTSSTATANTYAAGPITVLTSAANGSRRIFSYSPPVPLAATGLNFTAVGSGGMTVNWTDNAINEIGYVIYNSTDGGANYTFVTQTAANANSFAASGLTPSTSYTWKVQAVTEGAFGPRSREPRRRPRLQRALRQRWAAFGVIRPPGLEEPFQAG